MAELLTSDFAQGMAVGAIVGFFAAALYLMMFEAI